MIRVTKLYHAVRITTGQTRDFPRDQLDWAKRWVLGRLTGHIECWEIDEGCTKEEARVTTVFRVRHGEVLCG